MEKENLHTSYYVYDQAKKELHHVFGKDLFTAVSWFDLWNGCKTVDDCIKFLEEKCCMEFLTYEQYKFIRTHRCVRVD